MNLKNPLIQGTFFLTLAGILSRIIGFFYHIFISRKFGAEAMGLLQLTSPIIAFTYSLTISGIQTSLSKYVAEKAGNPSGSVPVLFTGLFWSTLLSSIGGIVIYTCSESLAAYIVHEPRTAILLRIIAFSFPLSAIHACLNGYFYGLRKTKIPASSQLLEQTVRVSSVIFLYHVILNTGKTPGLALLVIGSVLGEAVSSFFSLGAALLYFSGHHTTAPDNAYNGFFINSFRLFRMAIPLSANRLILNFLRSYEAIQIPVRLRLYGLTTQNALELYGVLTGMSMPLLFFPNILTNSVSTMLLPTISTAQASGNYTKIKTAIRKCVLYCGAIGVLATMFFLLFGQFLGMFLFSSKEAGEYIVILSFLCPFTYINTTLTSILHGLGKTFISMVLHVSALLLRLSFVIWGIPLRGITAYLLGILCCEIYTSVGCYLTLKKIIR